MVSATWSKWNISQNKRGNNNQIKVVNSFYNKFRTLSFLTALFKKRNSWIHPYGKGVEKDCIGPEKGKSRNFWCRLMQDIMRNSIEIMGGYLKGMKLLQNRKKRSVLPIIGKALNVLFGTVSEEELDVIGGKFSAFDGLVWFIWFNGISNFLSDI